MIITSFALLRKLRRWTKPTENNIRKIINATASVFEPQNGPVRARTPSSIALWKRLKVREYFGVVFSGFLFGFREIAYPHP